MFKSQKKIGFLTVPNSAAQFNDDVSLLKSQKNEKRYLSFVELVLTLIYKVKEKKRYLFFDEIVRITIIIYIFLHKCIKL